MPSISEKKFAQQVVDLATLLGWDIWRTWLSLHSPKGWPDMALAKELADGHTVLVLSELKSAKGKLTDNQRHTLAFLNDVEGVFTFCWRPDDWDSIVAILQAKGLSDIMILGER